MSKVKVFISSKQSEFRHERAEIFKILSGAPFVEPIQAENWSPQRQPVYDTFVSEVKDSPIYVGLFGCLYSEATEQEYRVAIQEPKREILIYFRDCDVRAPELARIYSEVSDPQRGHLFKVYSEWNDLQPYFLRHIEDAVGRMVGRYLEVAKAPEARADDDFFAKRAAARIRRLGLPPANSPEDASLWAENLSKSASYFRDLRAQL